MQYEERRSQEYIDGIVELLIKDDRWIRVRAKCERESEYHQGMQLLARKVLANARFEHSKENIEKLLQLNKRLHELQDECAKITFDIYKELMALMAQGKSYYKTFYIETYIEYESEENWEGEVSGLYDSYAKANRFEVGLSDAPGKEPADYKELNAYHEELSWNIEDLELPEFKDEYICFAMHKFFADGDYSLEDALRMKLEDFHIFTKIHI
jgi:ribosomal protein L19E